jgi:rRNA maturation endonuclease Nob1
MPSSLPQPEAGTEIGNERKVQGSHEVKCTLLQGKIVEGIQVCIRCRRKYPLKQGRKSCPSCSGLLIAKVTLIKEK